MQLDPQNWGGEFAFFVSQGFVCEDLPNKPGIHTFAGQGFGWEGLLNQLGTCIFASQGFAWEGLPNQLGIHTLLPAKALLGRPYRINLESTAAPHVAYLQW